MFWTHLAAGVTAGTVILIMSVTGVLLTYERQMLTWADRGFRVSAPNGGARLEPSELLQRVEDSEEAAADALTLHADPGAPAEVTLSSRVVYVDPYSGRVLGEGAKGIRRFFRTVTDWHRWLAMTGPNRQLGRTITGVCNLAFLMLVVSGMYIWFPRHCKWPQFRAVLLFRGGLAGKARDFNWHNVLGIWSAVPLFFVVLGALVISFPWATNLVYRVAGDTPPAPAQGRPPSGSARRAAKPNLGNLNAAWRLAESRVARWQTITFRIANSARAPLTFAITESHRGRPDKRSTLSVDGTTGQVISHETFATFSTGRQWRAWLRFIHTGEALGWAGQTVAGMVSAAGAVLVWTGLALSWRRYRSWRARGLSLNAQFGRPTN